MPDPQKILIRAGKSQETTVEIDGEKVRDLTGYTLTQSVNSGFARLTLDILARDVTVEGDVEVER